MYCGFSAPWTLPRILRCALVVVCLLPLLASAIGTEIGGGDGNFQNNFGFGSWKEQPFHMKKEFPIKEPFHMKKEFPIQKPFHIKKEFDHTKIPFHRRHYFKPVVKFIDIYKPRSEIYYCPPEVVDTCCNAKPYCSWNHWFYPSYGHPPKTCSVKVKDSWETYDLCEYPNMIWKYKDFECKCPEVTQSCGNMNSFGSDTYYG